MPATPDAVIPFTMTAGRRACEAAGESVAKEVAGTAGAALRRGEPPSAIEAATVLRGALQILLAKEPGLLAGSSAPAVRALATLCAQLEGAGVGGQVDYSTRRVSTDGLYLVAIDGAPTVRRIQRLPGGTVRTRSDEAPDVRETVQPSALRILGRVRPR